MLKPIVPTAADRTTSIATSILQTVDQVRVRLRALRQDQPGGEVKAAPGASGPSTEVLPFPPITKAMIDERLGAENVAMLDKIAAILGE